VVASAVRALCLGGATATWVIQALLWIFGILIVFVPLAVWRYRRSE
jgi:oleandomycin transport system permease protein